MFSVDVGTSMHVQDFIDALEDFIATHGKKELDNLLSKETLQEAKDYYEKLYQEAKEKV